MNLFPGSFCCIVSLKACSYHLWSHLVLEFVPSSPHSSSPAQLFDLWRSPLFTMGIMLKKPPQAAGSTAPAILIGLFVAFGGVLFG